MCSVPTLMILVTTDVLRVPAFFLVINITQTINWLANSIFSFLTPLFVGCSHQKHMNSSLLDFLFRNRKLQQACEHWHKPTSPFGSQLYKGVFHIFYCTTKHTALTLSSCKVLKWLCVKPPGDVDVFLLTTRQMSLSIGPSFSESNNHRVEIQANRSSVWKCKNHVFYWLFSGGIIDQSRDMLRNNHVRRALIVYQMTFLPKSLMPQGWLNLWHPWWLSWLKNVLLVILLVIYAVTNSTGKCQKEFRHLHWVHILLRYII